MGHTTKTLTFLHRHTILSLRILHWLPATIPLAVSYLLLLTL